MATPADAAPGHRGDEFDLGTTEAARLTPALRTTAHGRSLESVAPGWGGGELSTGVVMMTHVLLSARRSEPVITVPAWMRAAWGRSQSPSARHVR